MTLVDRIAWCVVRRHRALEMEDLRSSGYLGLVQAALAFRTGHGCSFRTFASHRILGAMRDEIRRDQRPQGFTRLRGRLTRQVPWPLDIDGQEDDGIAIDPSPDPLEQCARAEQRAILRSLVHSHRERVLVAGIQAGESQERIGRRLGLSQCRVVQLRHALIAKGRDALTRRTA